MYISIDVCMGDQNSDEYLIEQDGHDSLGELRLRVGRRVARLAGAVSALDAVARPRTKTCGIGGRK
jgi:hypothetical protein